MDDKVTFSDPEILDKKRISFSIKRDDVFEIKEKKGVKHFSDIEPLLYIQGEEMVFITEQVKLLPGDIVI